jgi:putative flippase GtrA
VSWRGTLYRWAKFNGVGAIGIVVQLAMLGLLKGALHLHYLLATGIAVEAAVLHNFLWHERWTWKDRTGAQSVGVAGRLARFHLGNGLVSLLTNLGMMRLLVGRFRMGYLAANVLSIGAGSLINFLVSDRLVFADSGRHDSGASEPEPGPPPRNTPGPVQASRERLCASRNAPPPPVREP